MSIAYAYSVMRPSAHGWRLTCFDTKDEPVASFWAVDKNEALRQARQIMTVS